MIGMRDRMSNVSRVAGHVAPWAGAVVLALSVSGGRVVSAAERLRVGVMPVESAVEWVGDRPVGVMVDIWEDLAGRLGVETEFVRVSTVPAMLDLLTSGAADIALGPVAITEGRERVIDLTHPIFHSGLRIAIRQRSETGFLAAVRSMVSWQLLGLVGAVVALALISGHLLWWFERRGNDRSFPASYFRGVGEAIWWIMSTTATGGCDDKHVDSMLGRIVAFSWMVGGIGLIATFTSVLTATMTAERVTGTIRGPRDLGGKTVGVQASAAIIPVMRQRGCIPQEYSTLHDAIAALEMGLVEAVVSESHQLMFLVSRANTSTIKIVGPVFESFDFGLGLQPGSPLREPINKAILRMREDGSLPRLIDTWLGKHD